MVKQDPRHTEEALYVLKTPPRPAPPEYRVVHVRAKESLAFKHAAVGADFWEAPIDAEAVHALERVWGTMPLGARWPNREEGFRKKWGGPAYTFDYRGDNEYGQGYVVPSAGTCTSELVAIGELLIRYTDEPDATKRQPIRAELLRRSNVLAARLQASGEPLAGDP